jgi:hypothetical protein
MVSLTETARSAYADRAVSFLEAIMANAALIGIDLGKQCVFLHAQDRRGNQVWRKKATRKQLYELLATCPACVVPWRLVPVRTGWHVNASRSATSRD